MSIKNIVSIASLQKIELLKAYTFSMLFIAILVGLSFFNLFFLIDKQKEYAQLINISGKQRMHSERVYSTLLLILQDPSKPNYNALESNLKIMSREYSYIKQSLSNLQFDQSNIYTNGYKNTIVQEFYKPENLLKRPADKKRIMEIIKHRDQIIEEFNRAVEQLQKKSDRLNEIVIQRGMALLVIILLVLYIISMVIFQPLLMQFKTKHQIIAQSNIELEQKVEERTVRLQRMLNIVNQYVYTTYTDTNGVITYVTDAFCELSGYSRDELVGKTHNIIKHPDNEKDVFIPLWQTLLKGDIYKGIIKNRHKNGKDYWLDSYIVPDRDEKGTIIGFQAFRQNVTDKIKLEDFNNELEKRVLERTKEIERIAVTDALTGLFNRHRFNVELEDAVALHKRYQTPITLAILDIDYFKKINDEYGHYTGDETLITLAYLLQQHMRQTDKLARWGGEEFVILFINTDLDGALMAAETLLEKIRAFSFKDVGLVTCSIGLATLIVTDTPEIVLKRADMSLYHAKAGGRNRVSC